MKCMENMCTHVCERERGVGVRVGQGKRCSTFASAFDWKTAKPIHRLTSSSGHNSLKKHLRKWNNIRVYKTHAWLARVGGRGAVGEGAQLCEIATKLQPKLQTLATSWPGGRLVVSLLTHCCGNTQGLPFSSSSAPPPFLLNTCFDSSRIRIQLL